MSSYTMYVMTYPFVVTSIIQNGMALKQWLFINKLYLLNTRHFGWNCFHPWLQCERVDKIQKSQHNHCPDFITTAGTTLFLAVLSVEGLQ